MMDTLTPQQEAELEAKIVKAKNSNAVNDGNRGWWYIHDGDGGYVIPWIGLQDVLIALDKSHYITELESDLVAIDPDGTFLLRDLIVNEYYRSKVKYDLAKDYHQQSPELKSFLYSLLCK